MIKDIFKKYLPVVMAICLICGCAKKDDTVVNVGSLKGPTTIGIVKLMDDTQNGKSKNDYNFEMAVGADELLPKVISGEIDIAMVPANVAAVLYNKTQGGIVVLDINTLGVLYAVSGDESINDIKDLAGKTIYVTNKGTTPDYVTQYLLNTSGLSAEDVNIEYMSEATEVAARLKENPQNIGILPQPFVTAACIQNEELKVVLDLTAKWNETNTDNGSRLVTGVTIARREFALNNKKLIESFMNEHKTSVEFVNSNLDEASQLVVSTGIIEKEPVAKMAIPKCNITYIDGEDMKKALSGYLSVLFEMDPATVGGSLPNEDFYY